MSGTALIIGITGNIGGASAAAFHDHGWRVRALSRNPDAASVGVMGAGDVEWLRGDAMKAEDVANAAAGADVIVHGANPPGYHDWAGLAMPMLDNTIEAAAASGARILFPGNVYPYGPDAWPLVAEDAPQHPVSRKGEIRVAMERRLMEASRRGVRSLILRAGDFFGAPGRSSWLGAVMIRPGRPVRSVTYPGAPEVGHAWAYLPDLAETFVRLAEMDDRLATCERLHFGGHYFQRGADMALAVGRAAGLAEPRVRRLSWPLLRLAAPFSEMLREVLEMRYLWQVDLRLDNRRLVQLLGSEPHTPLDGALRETLVRMGCLPGEDRKAASGRAA